MRIGMLRITFPDHHQAGRIVIRQRTNENGVYNGENRGVGADAEGESEDDDGGETRTAMQQAKRVAKIASGLVEPADDIYVASVFLEESGIAEAFLGFAAGFAGRHSGGEIVCGAHFEMRAQLFVEVAIEAISSQHTAQARDERHGAPSFRIVQAK